MHSRTILLLVPLASGLLYACSEGFEAEIPPGYEDVEYAGEANDEALASFVEVSEARKPTDVPSQKATLDVPTSGAVLPKIPLTEFAWHIGGTSERGAPSPTKRASFVVEDLSGAPKPPQWAALSPAPRAKNDSLLSPLRELVGPLRAARADGAPYSGTATFLVFSTPTNPKLVRVLTGDTLYSPSQAAWDKITTVGEPITLTLQTAVFQMNTVTFDGGPFIGSSIQFTVIK